MDGITWVEIHLNRTLIITDQKQLEVWSNSDVWVALAQIVQDVHVKLNPGLPRQKQLSTTRRLFTSRLDLNLRNKPVKCYIWSVALYGVETRHFGK
jgi:hypothetical protein